VMQTPDFQTNGQFDMNKWLRFLASPAAAELMLNLEARYRQQIPQLKLAQYLTADVYVPDAKLWRIWRDQHDSVTTAVVAVQTVNIPDTAVKVTDQDIQAYYTKHQKEFNRPAQVFTTFLALPRAPEAVDTQAALAEARRLRGLAAVSESAFARVAKQSSIDTVTGAKGGDLGWIVQGQTVPEFEKAAFSLNKGEMSDLIKTQYGFHIIKVLDKETAHTKTFDEVKDSIRPAYLLNKVDKEAGDTADKMSSDIRQSNKITLDELAQRYHLTVADTHPVGPGEPILELGNGQDVKDEIFHLRQGELSLPVHTDRGYVVLSLKQALPAHQGNLDEVRDKVIAEIKKTKADELAKAKASDLEKRVKSGEKFDAAAKSLGLDPKTSDLFARTGSVTDLGSGKQLAPAFSLKVGELGPALNLGANWAVYEVVEHENANPADFEKQKRDITDNLLKQKRELAFEAFHTSLEEKLRQDGTLKLYPEKMAAFGDFGSSKGLPISR